MRRTPKLLSCLICLTGITAIAQQMEAKESSEPQMVWLNSAEGEVTFSPGHKGKPELGKDWIPANSGQVMEDGYTLVTQKGRAEIEFENGTVVYLAANSVLQFDKLAVTEGKTETQLNLLTGTAAIAHVSRDMTYLDTPVVELRFVGTQTARLESTLDGVVIHAVEGDLPLVREQSGVTTLKAGESAAYVDGKTIPLKQEEETADTKEWGQWVAAHLAERRALLAEGLKETGWKEPTPGLAGMVKNGKFYDCAPYGKCWEPNEQTERAEAQTTPSATQQAPASGSPQQGKTVINRTLLSRCPMEAWMVSTKTGAGGAGNRVEYGTCFQGSWAHHRFVVGRLHHHPCYFVKAKNGIGIVPKHPLDVKGKTPINAKSGILVLVAEKGRLQAGVQQTTDKGIQLVASPRSGIERELIAGAPRVAQPAIQGKLVETIVPRENLGATRSGGQKNAPTIQYDFKTRNFVGGTGARENGHAEVVAHVASSANGASQVQMGGHASAGGSSGGSHGSTGGSSGGGHSGGTASSSSSASSASSSGGGGSHH
jgi:FecR protein